MRTPPMMTALLTLLALMMGQAACSSAPEIPDQQQAYSYQSTTGQAATSASPEATSSGDPEEGEPQEPSTLRAKGDVALVNGKPITAAEFNAEVDKLLQSKQVPPNLLGQLKERLVRGMIDKRLLDDAVAKSDVKITDADIDAKLKEVRDDFERMNTLSAGQMGSFEQMIQRMGLDPKNLRDSLKQAIVIERLVQQRGFEAITDEEVRAFYDENTDRFAQPESVRARHIIIKVPEDGDAQAWAQAKAKIEGVRAEITKQNKDFAKAAEEHSQDGSAKQGGDLGYFQKNRMVPEFEQAAWALKKGEVSQPVKSRFGWHLIKKEDHKAEGPMPFDEIKDVLKSQLNNQKFQQALMGYLDELRDSAKIELKLDNIT